MHFSWITHTQKNQKKTENQFSEDVNYKFTTQLAKNKNSYTHHAKQKRPLTRHEKSIGDPHTYV